VDIHFHRRICGENRPFSPQNNFLLSKIVKLIFLVCQFLANYKFVLI
jgi:hypothetical protein